MNATAGAGAPPSPHDQQVTPDPAADATSTSEQRENVTDIKSEPDLDEQDAISIEPNGTATTLRPDPPPSKKVRESEAPDASTTEVSDSQPPTKKRKRATSPPWQFPTAENATIKTADGRRVSARVNTGTPGLSETEGTRRRSSSSRTGSVSRPSSPPWKRFGAAGPTTVHVDGVRKSGRVNKELTDQQPKRISPRHKKQVDKFAASRAPPVQVKGKPGPKPSTTPSKVVGQDRRRSSAGTGGWAKVEELKARIAELEPSRSCDSPAQEAQKPRSVGRPRKQSHNESVASARALPSPNAQHRTNPVRNPSLSPEATRPSPRIKLRFTSARHAIPPPHPHATFPLPLRPPQRSLWQLLDDCDLKEMQQPYSENERGPPSRDEFKYRHQKAAEQESIMRHTIIDAGKPGGILSQELCSIYHDDQQREPGQQYGHVDHLVTHALYFRHLQLRESQQHRQIAKKIANEALDYWRMKRGPTEEDLRAEADKITRLVARQVVTDVKAKWDRVLQYIQERRKLKWEAEQEVKRQERLKRQLEWSENMVARQRGEMGSDADMSDISELGDDDDEDDSGEDEVHTDEEDSEENMSDEDNEDHEEDEDEGDMEEDTLQAYLAQRAVEPPDKSSDLRGLLDVDEKDESDGDEEMADASDNASSTRAHQEQENDSAQVDSANGSNIPPISISHQSEATLPADLSAVPVNEQDIDHAVPHVRSNRSPIPSEDAQGDSILDSDESTNMDSEDYDSDEDMSDSSDEDSEASEEGESDGSENPASRSGLLALFSKSELRQHGLPTPVTSAEGDNANDRDVDNEQQVEPKAEESTTLYLQGQDEEMIDEDADGDVHTTPAQPRTDLQQTTKMTSSSLRGPSRAATPLSQAHSDSSGKQLVPVPSLLRGTLRSYQHTGVDWLASLYRNGTNGILADEMGLGKTIQTIALFAYLAEQHDIWEAHLVIVPTSVILNWVTEFQKFLPGFRVLGYYGTTEERQAKRRGWANDPHHENKEKRGYNVVVTSYNVALKDINAIRNVSWHCMVLDEAHNIRNFNSQRFQVLIRLKTRARLLLTGTPLQNSLTELWSLLTFLTAGDDDPAHGSLEEFLSHWKDPVKEIFDRGVQTLSEEASKVVGQLHTSLRPFMLRRLKADVEKDLPKKTEHTVVCKLSKRQRQLYQDYMGLADTRAKLTQGNAVTAGKVLLSLRRVCNHPDLFDPRPIQTSFVLEKSPLEPYAIKERLMRRLFGIAGHAPKKLMVAHLETRRRYQATRSRQLSGVSALRRQVESLEQSLPQSEPDTSTFAGCQAMQRLERRRKRLQQLRDSITFSEASFSGGPVYGTDLREILTVRSTRASADCTVNGRMQITTLDGPVTPQNVAKSERVLDQSLALSSKLQQSMMTIQQRADLMRDTIIRFAFCTPEVTSPVLEYMIPSRMQRVIRASSLYPESSDSAHEARVRTSIVFPDSRLLVYDSGKLQRLTVLLRELQAKGSRSLIFTQMTGTLNILEQFLSLLNLPYLRLDGSTPVERRQLYSAEFNRPDSKYQCMILSSRAGGVGLNLTGASSVIFYDLDWNPQMDKQCMDRAHRIGQVRDVEVYKMVSEKTVEENILRRADQKSLLDQTVIQEGHFTTDYHRATSEDKPHGEDDVAAAIKRFLSGGDKALTKTIESVEDKEDVQAAQQARKEEMQDDEDFAERPSKGPSVPPTPGVLQEDTQEGPGSEGHVDGYMIRWVELMLKNVPYVPPIVRKLDKHGRDPSHRPKKRR